MLLRIPNWLGDAVMATPALRALHRAHPQAEIVLAGPAYLEALFRGLPGVSRYEAAPGPRGLRPLLRFTRRLAAGGFDQALILPDSPRAALPTFAARIPQRAGYARDALRRALLTLAVPLPQDEAGRRVPISMIERYLRITRAVGCPDAGHALELAVDPRARARLEPRLAATGLGEAPYAVITPGARFGASKLWPVEHFAEACDGLDREFGLRCVLAPGPGEEVVARAVAQRCRQTPIVLEAPVTDVAELVALVSGARLVLSNDTGPRHVAVACDVPVVTLMGPTDPRHTQHLMARQRVLREPVPCSPCHHKRCPIDHRCMTRLAPRRALDAAAELLA